MKKKQRMYCQPNNMQYYDPYLGFGGINKTVRIRPSVSALQQMRRYEKGEPVRVKPVALHGLICALAQSAPAAPYRAAQEVYRMIENFLIFELRRSFTAGKQAAAKPFVPASELLLARRIATPCF